MECRQSDNDGGALQWGGIMMGGHYGPDGR